MKLRQRCGNPAAAPAHSIMQASYGPTPLDRGAPWHGGPHGALDTQGITSGCAPLSWAIQGSRESGSGLYDQPPPCQPLTRRHCTPQSVCGKSSGTERSCAPWRPAASSIANSSSAIAMRGCSLEELAIATPTASSSQANEESTSASAIAWAGAFAPAPCGRVGPCGGLCECGQCQDIASQSPLVFQSALVVGHRLPRPQMQLVVGAGLSARGCTVAGVINSAWLAITH